VVIIHKYRYLSKILMWRYHQWYDIIAQVANIKFGDLKIFFFCTLFLCCRQIVANLIGIIIVLISFFGEWLFKKKGRIFMTEYSDSPKTNSRDIENSPHKNPKNRPQKKLYIYIYILLHNWRVFFGRAKILVKPS